MNAELRACTGESVFRINNHLPDITDEAVIEDILTGLTAGQKYIPSTYFYDVAGSALFEQITGLPEYYPTRTEMPLIEMAGRHIGDDLTDTSIIELGSGDCSKISTLLHALSDRVRQTVHYVPVDVCPEAIKKSAEILARTFPSIAITGCIADFFSQLHIVPDSDRRLFCFFGSTIGNFTREQAVQFFQLLGKIMHPGDRLLIGMDMVKDRAILERAYNDSQGITAAFNRNILSVVNTRAGTDFEPEAFAHVAFYNDTHERIEMHLQATREMKVTSPHLTEPIHLRQNETILTEYSHKYTAAHIETFCDVSGLDLSDRFTDPDGWFSLLHVLKR